ncbi:uncharacterized protein PRCAT00004504001 [Priceomyces carsonii]|uniref:uncharacterized protein n=1 Tax=Priceomyces carsonii TaxID=28549 RepID=UPI002EDA8421|nr:unnamed protein product [Priceomyces carsonii]
MTKVNKLNEYAAYEKGQFLLNKRYKHISKLQEGSFGRVTLAIDTETNDKVAVKAMYKSNAKEIARHEIKMLSKLGKGGENICQLLDSFETVDFVILILEYCHNGDLYDLIHSSVNISALDIWNIAKELSNALNYAHSQGVYHRDIKPENVLFNGSGRVKLCDWGLSTTKRFNQEFNVGTDKYMAPECFVKRQDFTSYDAKMADLWSLGITVLTAVFGTSPFKRLGESKSVESDYNFKTFVHYNNPQILYDIYPMMNQNCYNIFMNLLKTGGVESDTENYNRAINSRSLDKFISDLQDNWKYGLTIDEEYEFEDDNEVSENVFDMDHDSLDECVESLSDSEDFEAENDNCEMEHRYESSYVNIPVKEARAAVPSLVESSTLSSTSKSWCDLDDGESLVQVIGNLSVTDNKKTAEQGNSEKCHTVRVLEHYLGSEEVA